MPKRRPAPTRAASTILVLATSLLAGAALPAGASAAPGDVTAFPLRADQDGNAGITAGSDGALWLVDAGLETDETSRPATIWRVTTDGDARAFPVAPNPTPENGKTVGPIVAGADGNLWYPDMVGGITRLSTSGTSVSFPAPRTANAAVQRLAAAPNGDLWWGAISERLVGKITPAGVVSEYEGPAGSGPSAIFGPGLSGIAIGADGNPWFGGLLTNQLYRTTSLAPVFSDQVLEVPAPAGEPTSDMPSAPTGLALGADGNMWFNHTTSQVGKVTPSGTMTMYPKRPGSSGGFGLTAGADGNMWYSVAPRGDGPTQQPARIGRITPTGVTTEWSLAAGVEPVDMTTGADGNLWMTDTLTSAVLRFQTGAPAAVVAAPRVEGTATPGATLSCVGGTFSTWGGAQPTLRVEWLRDGAPVAGQTGRSYAASAADAGRAVSCRVTGRYAVPAVWAPATSEALRFPSAETPSGPTPGPPGPATPTPTPTPTPEVPAPDVPAPNDPTPPVTAPVVVPQPGPQPTPRSAPTPKPGATPATPAPASRTQIITCKFLKAKGKPKRGVTPRTTCRTTVIPTPASVSSRTVAATINRRGKAHKATVLVGKGGLRISNTRLLPKGPYILKAGKQRWAIKVG